MSRFETSKRWSDHFLPQIKRILGLYLIGEAPTEEDQKHNTDLIVLDMKPLRIAVRVRRFKYADQYQDEFTIRTNRPSGQPTELAKILAGWGDYLFYGFSDEHGDRLAGWVLADLSVFRQWYVPNKAVGGFNNRDGSSSFAAFPIAAFPSQFVIARKPLCPSAIS